MQLWKREWDTIKKRNIREQRRASLSLKAVNTVSED